MVLLLPLLLQALLLASSAVATTATDGRSSSSRSSTCAGPAAAGDAVHRVTPCAEEASQAAATSTVPIHAWRPVHRRPDGVLALHGAAGEPPLCVEPVAAPTPWACASSHDCQLNGRCVDGRCDCDAAWKGERCEELALDGDGAYAYGGPTSTITSWGGGPPAFDAASGNFTLFVTEIAGHCGLSEWSGQSTIVAATAASAAGPFERQRVAVGCQAHNPYYAYDSSTKTHVIFHIVSSAACCAAVSLCRAYDSLAQIGASHTGARRGAGCHRATAWTTTVRADPGSAPMAPRQIPAAAAD